MRISSGLGAAVALLMADWTGAVAQDPAPLTLPPQAIADLARGVKTIPDLNAAAKTGCSVEPWQVSFAAEGASGVRVARSPTMPARQARCVFALVAQSRFRLANAPLER